MFEKTYLDQISDNHVLSGKLSEDTSAVEWTDNNKLNGLYVEFNYNTTKRFVIYRNENSRQVNIKTLIFKINNDSGVNPISLYYTIEQSTDKNDKTPKEPCYPLIAEADTSDLNSYIKSKI